MEVKKKSCCSCHWQPRPWPPPYTFFLEAHLGVSLEQRLCTCCAKLAFPYIPHVRFAACACICLYPVVNANSLEKRGLGRVWGGLWVVAKAAALFCRRYSARNPAFRSSGEKNGVISDTSCGYAHGFPCLRLLELSKVVCMKRADQQKHCFNLQLDYLCGPD